MKTIVILGHYTPFNSPLSVGDLKKEHRFEEIWCMNDWYMFYPNIKRPDYVFQIHDDFKGLPPETGRWLGDWKKIYNDSGAKIIVTTPCPDIPNASIINRGDLKFNKKIQLASAVNIMFAYMLKYRIDVKRVILRNFHLLTAGEYANQFPYFFQAIEELQKIGIVVDSPMMELWQDKAVYVDFANLKEVDVLYGEKITGKITVDIKNDKVQINTEVKL
ncbi:MAG: hypothetical protein A2017_06630 [Lentisphaerae bacterium GWF2_44_16]|nr:MAG: hypothetical protein A2017_06630 [Lentisphaerae bacterium GWF2_44_16]